MLGAVPRATISAMFSCCNFVAVANSRLLWLWLSVSSLSALPVAICFPGSVWRAQVRERSSRSGVRVLRRSRVVGGTVNNDYLKYGEYKSFNRNGERSTHPTKNRAILRSLLGRQALRTNHIDHTPTPSIATNHIIPPTVRVGTDGSHRVT